MYPFAIINSFGSKIERVYRQFAAKVNKEIFPAIRRDVARYVSTDGIIQDAANVLELLEEIRLNYGDYVDDALLTKIISENINLLDGWSTSQLNKMISDQNAALGVGNGLKPFPTGGVDKPVVPLIPKKNVVSMQNIPLANNTQRLLQNDAYSKYFFDVEEIINNGIIDGLNADEITKQILDKVDMNAKRARFWAEDQASIFQAEQTRLKAIREGHTHYRWKCRGNARPSHAVHRDQIYSWNVGVNNLSRPGARHPGEDYRCHCEPELVTPDQIAAAGVGNPSGRSPQSTAGLIENYTGSEAVKAKKGKAFQESSLSFLTDTLLGNLKKDYRVSALAATTEMNRVIDMDKVYEQSPIQFQAMSETNPLIKKASGTYNNGVITLNESSSNAMLTVIHETAHHLEEKILAKGLSFLQTSEGQGLLSEIKNTKTFKTLLAKKGKISPELYSYFTKDSEIFTRIMEQYFAKKRGGILKKELLGKANFIQIQDGVDLYLTNQEFKKIESLIDQIFKSKGLMR